MAQHRLFWAPYDGTLGLKTDLEAARMCLQKAVDGDSEDEEEEDDELARLSRKLQVGYDVRMGTVRDVVCGSGIGKVLAVVGGGDGRGGGARIVTIGIISDMPLETAF